MAEIDRAAAQLAGVRRIFLHHVDGMGDDEFLWEPVDGCWSVRERDGRWVFEAAYPDPDPAPFTTIAWLTVHMTRFLYGAEQAVRDRPIGAWPATFGTAAEAIAEWTAYADGLAASLADRSDEDLMRGYAVPRSSELSPVGDIVWRAIHEAIHHSAEVTRMRHLYANRSSLIRPS